MEKRILSEKEGFSLIEVIIAITLLAILSIPVLMYFVNASVQTSDGKDDQRAELVAQSVVEELNSCTSFEQMEDELIAVSGSTWSVVSTGSSLTGVSKLKKEMEVDGFSYQAQVSIDYDYSADVDTSTNISKYNTYATPQLKEVYSTNNVVAAETDQNATAVSNFFYNHTADGKSVIQGGIDRTMCISIEKDDTDTLYLVKVYYEYTYKGDTHTEVVKDTKIERDRLNDIYLFYNPYRSDVDTEKVAILCDSTMLQTELEKISLYLVCQNSLAVTPPGGYKIQVDVGKSTGGYLNLDYYTNNIPMETVTETSKIVEYKEEKRIAKITVDVYRGGETVFDESTRILQVQTSKGV